MGQPFGCPSTFIARRVITMAVIVPVEVGNAVVAVAFTISSQDRMERKVPSVTIGETVTKWVVLVAAKGAPLHNA